MPGFPLLKKCLASPVLIVAVALVVRLLAVPIVMAKHPFHGNEPSHIAAHIAAGQGFSSPYEGVPIAPTAQQPPAYPFYLAPVFRIFGSFSRASLIVLLLANAVVGSLVPLLLCHVGRRWFGASAGLLAAWAWAVLPWIAAADLALNNYLFSAAFLLLWLLLIPKDGGMTAKRSALGGAVLGAGVLLNPMLGLLWPASRRWIAATKRAAGLSLAAAVLMVSPWLIRNYHTMGHVYPALRDNLGMELYIGNHAGMDGRGSSCYSALCQGTENYLNADYPGNGPKLFAALGEQAFMRRQLREALSYIRSDLAGFALRTAKRCASFWLLPEPILNLVILVLAVGGLFYESSLRSLTVVLLALYPLAFYITQVTWAASYRLPIEPLVLLSAASLTVRASSKPARAWWRRCGRITEECFSAHRHARFAIAGCGYLLFGCSWPVHIPQSTWPPR